MIAANGRLTRPTNKRAAERAGLRLLEAFAAFAGGRLDVTADLLIDIRPEAHAVGGSHAQRDVIDLTLIAAAARSGQADLARALVTERAGREVLRLSPWRSLAASRPVYVMKHDRNLAESLFYENEKLGEFLRNRRS